MNKIIRRGGLYSLASVFIATLVSGAALAAASPSAGSANGYRISPVRTDLTIKPGESETTTIYVQNVSNAVENLQVLVNDFQARNDESGSPALLLNGKNAPAHGLRQYVTLSSPAFTLQPNEQKGVDVRISIPANASGGGYFGAVRVAPTTASGDKNINLAASVASLILVKVPGNVTEQVSIAGFEVVSGSGAHTLFTSSKNLSAAVRFHNTGNIQEEPFGKIQVKKGSKVIGSYEINSSTPRGNVLPDSIRKFTVSIGNVGSLGKYTLQGNFGYGSNGQLLSASTTFYVVPVSAIALAVVLLVLILLAIFMVPRWLRAHDRSVLRRAGRR